MSISKDIDFYLIKNNIYGGVNILKIYSRTNCPKCKEVKLKLERNDIKFEEINLDEKPEYREKLIKNKFLSLPVMEFKDGYMTNSEGEINFYIREMVMGNIK